MGAPGPYEAALAAAGSASSAAAASAAGRQASQPRGRSDRRTPVPSSHTIPIGAPDLPLHRNASPGLVTARRKQGYDTANVSENTRLPMRRFARLRSLDRNVTALGIVSLVADLSSEMVYPLFPVFVTTVLGAPVAVLGLIEGIAEATASLTRYPFGRASDELGRRRVFVVSGYGLSALGKLVLALAAGWPVALAGRFVDRVGKGVRTAPRDALLAAGVPDADRGLAFGLHRSLDTLGAVLGPLAALVLVDLGLSIRSVLLVAVVPGVVSVLVILVAVRERAPRRPLAHGDVCTCRPRRPSAGCWPPRSSSPPATPATSSSCSGPRRWATE